MKKQLLLVTTLTMVSLSIHAMELPKNSALLSLELCNAIVSLQVTKVQELLENGADANKPVLSAQKTPLQLAVGYTRRKGINTTGLYKGSPSSETLIKGTKIINLLLQHGADPTAKNKQGQTIFESIADQLQQNDLLRAAQDNQYEKVHDIVTHGTSPNCIDRLGNTPLHHAISTLNKNLITFLIQHGADVTTQCKSGATPLHVVASLGQGLDWAKREQACEVAKLLLDASASVDVKNKYGKTPIDIAKECHDHAMVELLETHEPS